MTERIDIVVTERGARTVRRNIENIGDGAQAAQGAVQLLRRALGALGVAFGVRELVNLVDTFTNLQNRLRTVTDSVGELGAVTESLFEVANRTRSSFEGTVEVFSRTALAARDLGVSQQQVIEFTESLNQAVILSGASAQEANNALIQLSQGLASGALRGDELRSVLEQLPVVADVIADSLGVTRGELRELGAQGRITSQDILRAFQEARVELEERFGETVPTIGQAFTVLRNNLVQFIGGLDQATGASSALAQAILILANNMELLGRITGAVAIIIGTVLARRAIGAAIAGVRTLTAVIAANPLGALAVAITTVIALLVSFSDQIRLSSDGAATLADFFVASFEVIGDGLTALGNFFSTTFSFIETLLAPFVGQFDISFQSVLTGAAILADRLVGTFAGAFNAIVAIFRALPAALGELFELALNGLIRAVENALNFIVDGFNQILDFFGLDTLGGLDFGEINLGLEGSLNTLGTNAREAFLEGFNQDFFEGTIEGIFDRAEELAQEREARQLQESLERQQALEGLNQAGPARVDPASQQNVRFQNFLRDLERENELLLLNNDQRRIQATLFQAEEIAKRELTEAERALITELVETNIGLERQQALLEQIRGPAEQYEQQVGALNALFERGAINAEEFARAQREIRLEFLDTQQDFASGVERTFLRLQEQAADSATQIESVLTTAFSAAEDAFVDFVQGGELSFANFIDTIQEQLLRLAFQNATAELGGLFGLGGGGGAGFLGSLFGGGGGGGLGSLFSGLFGFQNGGSFMVNAASGVGSLDGFDNRLVAFRARDGERVTVTPPGQSGGGSTNNITFNIQTPDAESFRRSQGQIFASAGVAIDRASRRNN